MIRIEYSAKHFIPNNNVKKIIHSYVFFEEDKITKKKFLRYLKNNLHDRGTNWNPYLINDLSRSPLWPKTEQLFKKWFKGVKNENDNE